MSSEDVKAQISESRRKVDLAQRTYRLETNSDFIEVIQKNLIHDRTIELTSELSLLNPESFEYKQILRELDAISYLRNYFVQLILTGAEAQDSLQEAQNLLNSEY